MDAFLNNPIYPLLSTEISTWTEPEALYEKKNNGLLFTTSNEYIWPEFFFILVHRLKNGLISQNGTLLKLLDLLIF